MFYTKNSLFDVTSLCFPGKSVIDKAGITKCVRKIKRKMVQSCLKTEFSGAC